MNLADIMENMEPLVKNRFGGVDILKVLFQTWPRLNIETQTFSNVVDGVKDSNGLENSDYRCRVGKIFADALLHDKYTLWCDHAETLCTHVGHGTVDALKTDHEHFFHVARTMDAHLSIIVTWIRKSLPTTVNLYSATAPICDTAKGTPSRSCLCRGSATCFSSTAFLRSKRRPLCWDLKTSSARFWCMGMDRS